MWLVWLCIANTGLPTGVQTIRYVCSPYTNACMDMPSFKMPAGFEVLTHTLKVYQLASQELQSQWSDKRCL